jgi:radical SAM-linked protein
VPLRFSQGFNPHPRLSLPLPRGVGVSGDRELLLVEIESSKWDSALLEALQKQLPVGMRVSGSEYLPRKTSVQPAWARYLITLTERVDRAALRKRLEEFLSASEWPVHRPTRGRHPNRTIDLRTGVTQMALSQKSLSCTIVIDPAGTVRLDELRDALSLAAPQQVEEIRRVEIGYPALFQTGTDHAQIGKTN